MSIRSTYTFVILEVSHAAYQEIRGKLEDAGYSHVFQDNGAIDMTGIALAREKAESATARVSCTCDFTGEEMEAAASPWHRRGCPLA